MSETEAFHSASVLEADILAAIHQESFHQGEAWDAQDFVVLLEDPLCAALLFCEEVAGSQPEPVGFVLWRQVVDEAEIITIATRPAYRRRGKGREMISACLGILGERKAAALFLEVAEDNIPAQALYLGCGFRLVGRRKGYYRPHQPGQAARDALVLSYFLT